MVNEKCLERYNILCTIMHHHCGTRHGSMSMKIVLKHTKCTCGIFYSWYKLCQNGRVDKKSTFTHDDTVGTVTWYKNVTFLSNFVTCRYGRNIRHLLMYLPCLQFDCEPPSTDTALHNRPPRTVEWQDFGSFWFLYGRTSERCVWHGNVVRIEEESSWLQWQWRTRTGRWTCGSTNSKNY